jgi:hypothetical protein
MVNLLSHYGNTPSSSVSEHAKQAQFPNFFQSIIRGISRAPDGYSSDRWNEVLHQSCSEHLIVLLLYFTDI